MPENETPTTPPGTTNEPSSTAPTSGASPGWKAGSHSRFAGRSPEEILGIAEALASVAERFNQQVPAAPPAPPANKFDLDLPDDEYLTGRQVKGIMQRLANQPAPVDYAARQQAAGALLAAVQMQRADDFKRWGGEINVELAKLPPEHWTLDNLKIVVDIVKSRHIDELARETAERLVNESHPTIRSGTGGTGSGPLSTQRTLDSDTLPRDWVNRAKAAGIDEHTIKEFCDVTGLTPEQYFADLEKYGKGGVIRG